nr:tyrosine-type recombinase/integrase [Brevundimonas diminuta]
MSAFRDRHGTLRYRYRKVGRRTVYLHGLPGSAQFAAEYEAAANGVTTKVEIGASRTVPGSINALAVAIYGSAEWAQLSRSTQATYRGIIERLRTEHGDKAVRAIRQEHILLMRDRKATLPSAANNLITGDVRKMGLQHVQGGAILVRQEKTKAFLELPIHPRLKQSLDAVPPGQMLFLVTQSSVGFTAGGFGNWFRSACRQAGIADRSAHGLRKSAATRLADAGCTEAQIKAVTGHQTSKEVERYTKARDQRLLATAAFAMIGGTQGEQNLANPDTKIAKSTRN